MLHRLYEQWGIDKKTNAGDRKLLEKWQTELRMDEGFILHCAQWAMGTGKPMLYLDAILMDYAEKGIRTTDAADAAHEAHQQAKPAAGAPQQTAAARGSRVIREQQYEQRDYEASTGLPDWMRDLMDKEDSQKHEPQ